MVPSRSLRPWHWLLALALAAPCSSAVWATADGGLYVAGAGFSFREAAERGLAQNSGSNRFFLLTLPPEAGALGASATPAQQRLRERVLAANGVLLVCQRDLDHGRINADGLAAGVVPVRGNGAELPVGQRYYAGENPLNLPSANKALRRLRSTCT